MNAIPALAGYLNTMNGPPDGSGNALTFSASACYASSGISLTVATAGSGAGSVSGSNCSTGAYASGTAVGPCTATASGGSTFSGWSSSGSASCSGTGTCPATGSFSLTGTTVLTATFTGGTPTCGNPYQNAPNFSGTYTVPPTTLPLSIGFTSPTSGCAMFMTLDGSTPTCSSTAYAGQNITTTTTMRVIACQGGYTSSTVEGGVWTISTPPPAAPTNLTGTVTLTGTASLQ